jgi:hypothetical protein
VQSQNINLVEVLTMNDIKNVNFDKFEDEFGNLLNEFEVIKYEKYSNGEWKETERKPSGRNTYIVEGQLYFRLDNSLIALNMDFNSKTCGACYQIGKTIEDKKKISGNEILFTCKANTGNMLLLYKQSYSDGTCFYCLKDGKGNWKVAYGNNNINELVNQIKHEIEIEEQQFRKMVQYPQEVQNIYSSALNIKHEVLNNMLALAS